MESSPAPNPPPITRRRFLRRLLRAGVVTVGAAGLVAGYGFWEASQIQIRRASVPVPNLPHAFEGKTVALLADFHHGPYVGIQFIRDAVKLASTLAPDMFVLLGDFAHSGARNAVQLPACLEALSDLKAPLGVFAVPGNHDMQKQGAVYREVVAATPIMDLTNRSIRLTVGGEHLWLAGLDDLWLGRPDQEAALKDIPDRAAVVMLCHNPDFAEENPNGRVGLMLSGHTHGGQIYLPLVGSPWIPSRYGDKYRCGLVQGPASKVFVSRGIGETAAPLRLNCPPEINLLTLVRQSA